jgi:hypothetical protein
MRAERRGVGGGGRVDATAGGKNLGTCLDGLGEVAGDLRQCGEEEVAEAVALEVALTEAVLKEAAEEVFVFRERDHAVADVAGGSMLRSSRRRPEEPPSSVTVTMAESSRMRQGGRRSRSGLAVAPGGVAV